MSKHIHHLSEDEFLNFKAGNHTVFRKIFDSYNQQVYNYTYSFCKNHEEAEELVQEVFIALYLNREKIEHHLGLYPYLSVVAKRLTISLFRRKIVESRFEEHLKIGWEEGSKSTESRLDSNELNHIWTGAIKSLPHKQKEVYEMNKLDGLSYQEIAEKIGVSKNTVKNQLIMASKKIKLIVKSAYLLFF